MYDVIIVGAGPAGLSAALVLGRCRRQVLLCDAGQPRNAVTRGVHGYLTRDGIPPRELLRLGHAELARYDTVEPREAEVTAISAEQGSFAITLEGGQRARGRKLLLATGVVDDWPSMPGAEALYGTSIHHCPYCDGWEWRDQPLAAYGSGEEGYGLALELLCWSSDVVLCSDGPASLLPYQREHLRRLGIGVREQRVLALEGEEGHMRRIVFAQSEPLERHALFFSAPQHQRSIFPVQLGCQFTSDGAVLTDAHEATCVPGVYVAGDASRRAQFAIVAAGEGALAAAAINTALLKEDLARRDE